MQFLSWFFESEYIGHYFRLLTLAIAVFFLLVLHFEAELFGTFLLLLPIDTYLWYLLGSHLIQEVKTYREDFHHADES
jgi:hypothetical protein